MSCPIILYKVFTHAIVAGRQCRRTMMLQTMYESIGSLARPVMSYVKNRKHYRAV